MSRISNATSIVVRAGVRYWEDATVNGAEDTDGTLIPFRAGEYWCPIIDLADGRVHDWPQGMTASIHYKVCDDGKYWLAGSDGVIVAKWAGFYVPDEFLCHGSNGYGDYIIFDVNADGFIEKYRAPSICDGEWDANQEKGNEAE